MSNRVSAGLLVTLAWVAAASAQPRQVEVSSGPGVKVSAGSVLHPTVGIRSGFISNVFFQEKNPVNAGILYVTAGLHLASLPPVRLNLEEFEGSALPKLEFRLGGSVRYQEYLTSNTSAQKQRDLGAVADAELVGFPYGAIRFELENHYARYVRPRNFETSGNLNRDVNDAHVGVVIQPGGRMLQVGVAYENTLDLFEASRAEFANRFQHRARLRFDWTFLPFTKAFFEGSIGFFNGLGGGAQKVSSMPLRLQLGLATAITPTFTVRAHAGFAKGFYDTGADFQSPIGGVDLGWEYRPLGRIELGYQFDFRDSVNANFYSEHMARLAISQGIRRAVVTAFANGYLRNYRGIPAFLMPSNGATVRSDVIGEAGVELSYYLRQWLVVSANYQISAVKSDVTYSFMGVLDDPGYLRHDATLGVEVRY